MIRFSFIPISSCIPLNCFASKARPFFLFVCLFQSYFWGRNLILVFFFTVCVGTSTVMIVRALVGTVKPKSDFLKLKCR